MDSESRFVVRKMCLDFFILSCVAFPLLAFSLWVAPYERGYFRDDRSLMLPYRPSTIPTWLIALIGFLVNIVTVVSVEIARSRRGGISPKYRLMGYSVPASAIETYRVLGVFLFGACCQQLTTTVGKYAVGRLRPHFFSVCDPLADPTLPADEVYVQQYTCRGTDSALLKDMRLSFPSAHSAFAAYAFLFYAMYMQCRYKWGSKLLLHGLQFVAVLFAWYTGLTRVADNKHHAGDVAAGFLIGALYAVVVFAYACHLGERAGRAAWKPEARRFGPEVPYQGATTPGPA